MKYRKIFIFIAAISIFLLYGCGNSGKSGAKTVKAAQFTDLIFDNTDLLPNTDFTWNMGKEDFLSKVYRADILDPDSGTFDEYRYSHSRETNTTTFTPLISYTVDGIPGEAEAAFAFNEEGLFKSGYAWVFKEGEEDKAKKAVEILADNFNTNENLTENQLEIPDLTKEDMVAFPYRYQWLLTDSSQGYVELVVSELKKNIIVQVTVGI